jgi:predicted enzyme related to lactoylglutathione lyase
MGKITGIGGVFLHQVEDLKKLLKWYQDVLGIQVSDYGLNFPEQAGVPLVTFDRPKDKHIMMNFSVEDLENYVEELREKDVEIVSDIQKEPFGKFVQILDPLGQHIELCELDREAYLEVVNKEIKAFKEEK